MVREVEIKVSQYTNIVNQTHGYDELSSTEDATKDKFLGILREDGTLLDLTLNITMTGEEICSSIFMLDYNAVDYSNRSVLRTQIGDIVVRDGLPPDIYYEGIDLSPVLELPQQTSLIDIENSVDIALFTYEANIIEEYGVKRLSVPYKVIGDTNLSMSTSTDGLYTVHFAIVRHWNTNSSFVEGQVTTNAGTTYTCIVANKGALITDGSFWRVSTAEDIRAFTSGTTATLEDGTLVSSSAGMLITRALKQDYIYDILTGLSYRTEDDLQAKTVLENMKRYRELSLFYLEDSNHLQAQYLIDKAKVEYRHFKYGTLPTPTNNKSNTYTL